METSEGHAEQRPPYTGQAAQVLAFQEKIGAARLLDLTQSVVGDDEATELLAVMSIQLASMSDKAASCYLASGRNDERMMRARLLLEELAELMDAMCGRQEAQCLDAVADLLYVVVGTGVTFNLPIEQAFQEVHRSNMTKGEVRHCDGVKGKGDGFSPPDLDRVMRDWRRSCG